MPRQYTTQAGDMLDLICFRHYGGRQAGAVEAVLEANQSIGLSDYPEQLPFGLTITLPELPSGIPQIPLVRLWD